MDRNRVGEKTTIETLNVALHPEGVDRNSSYAASRASINVALHPEGVDRNLKQIINVKAVPAVALHPEGVDRNSCSVRLFSHGTKSPSTRRAWIEISSR